MSELTPTAGQWYIRPDGLKFEVIDIDEDGLIEVQNQDGALDEIDADEWSEIYLELATQSEDATAPFDNVPLPDEAEGGDPLNLNSTTSELQRVSNDDHTQFTDEDSNEDESIGRALSGSRN